MNIIETPARLVSQSYGDTFTTILTGFWFEVGKDGAQELSKTVLENDWLLLFC